MRPTAFLVYAVIGCGGPPPAATQSTSSSTSTPAPASGRPQNLEQLADAAIAALRAGDGDAFVVQLTPGSDELVRLCPGSEGMLDAMRENVQRRVAKCAGAFDWKQARRVRVSGGTASGGKSCNPAITYLEKVVIELDVGGQPHRLELDEPMRMPSGLAVGDGPRCD
jgi:hypothetical protein